MCVMMAKNSLSSLKERREESKHEDMFRFPDQELRSQSCHKYALFFSLNAKDIRLPQAKFIKSSKALDWAE